VGHRGAAGCREGQRRVAHLARVRVGLVAARHGQIGDDLRAGEHVHAVEHLRLDRDAIAAATIGAFVS
jgi:hypothetical protein